MGAQLDIDQKAIIAFCKRHPIKRLALFGSVLRDDFHADSDIDMLVVFDDAAHVSLLDIAAMEIELSALLGRKVDLRTPAELSRHFRDQVVRTAELLYAA